LQLCAYFSNIPTGTAAFPANVTFAAVIDDDVAKGKNAKSGGSNAESLLWLKRAMEFIMLLLAKVSESKDEVNHTKQHAKPVRNNDPPLPPEQVKKCAQDSYEVSLGKHHNFIVRKTTSAMMGTAPSRAELIGNLGPRWRPRIATATLTLTASNTIMHQPSLHYFS
jgi:hypothetical protein